ncbi:twin-arginine translocation signal domain-containing protein [Streptomyces sp. NPDC020379]|uniref:twin-arginine translocation signal domain-containing protein n=1 Tax=Streptomyces sp. NPDC020379 TaxID=3365071 RepID=UPI003798EE2A
MHTPQAMLTPRARQDHLRGKETDDHRLAVYDELTDTGHILSPVCAAVFRLADGSRALEALAAAVARVHPAADTDVVRLALAELHARDLLDGPVGEPDSATTRRRALRRVAAAGAGAAVLPLIESVAHPGREAAATAPA